MDHQDDSERGSISPPLPPGPTSYESSIERIMQVFVAESQRRDALLERLLIKSEENVNIQQPETAQQGHFHIVPDLSKNVPIFSGKSCENPQVWLDTVKSMKTLFQWPDTFSLETARSSLQGGAHQWYLSRRNEIRNFQDFEQAFRKTFVRQEDLPTLWKKMSERNQSKHEDINEYFHEKCNLCTNLKLNFQDTKQQILIGLYDNNLCTSLLSKTHDDLDELLRDIQEYEKVERARVERTKSQYPRSVQYKENGMREDNHTANRQERKPDRNEEGKPLCFNCRNYGHVARYCRENREQSAPTRPQVCFTCRRAGHQSRNCPRNQTSSDTQLTLSEKRKLLPGEYNRGSRIDKYVKEIEVNRMTRLAMIDAGSAVCTVKRSVARDLNLPEWDTDYILFGFGGYPAINIQKKTKVLLRVDDVEEQVELLIVSDDAQTIDFLIGRSFTERENIAYIKMRDTLYFGYEQEEPFKNLEWNHDRVKESVFSGCDLTINKGEINCIHVRKEPEIETSTNEERLIQKDEWIGEIRGVKDVKKTEPVPNYREPVRLSHLNLGKGLKQGEPEILLNLVNDFRDVFATNLSELGCTKVMEVKIKDNNVPVRSKPYRASHRDRDIMKNILEEWKQCGIIRETSSPYASPVLLVPKASGEQRLVVDFRRLNKQTEKTNFPIPNLEDCFDTLTGCVLFCTLDLMSGYLQVPLEEESKAKTAFITPDETAEFQRLCFGLVNAPYEFSKLMSIVLGPLRNNLIVSYLDDLLIPARDFSDMCTRLKLVFNALRKAGLTLKLNKCRFGETTVSFLGLELSERGLRPGKIKLDSIEKFVEPKDKHEVRRYLGLTGYFRKFITGYANIARPLTDLLKEGKPYVWELEQQKAFESLKQELTRAPTLALFNRHAYTELHCDASKLAIAGMLLQKGEDGKLHLVYCLSKKTNAAEQVYPASKLELLAIVYCIERLRHWLLGMKFVVVSDCQALVYLNVKKTLNPQIARWYQTLAEYDFEIKYRAGEKMAHVDCLSRAATEEPSSTEMIEEVYMKRIFTVLTEEDRILMIQRSDEKLTKKIDILRKELNDQNQEEKNEVKDYVLQNGRIFKKVKVNGEVKFLYVIPDSMRKSTVVRYHDLKGHWSLDKTAAAILQKFWFRGLRRYVRRHIKGCFECLVAKMPGGKLPGLLHPPSVPSRPMIKLHLDHLGPFPKSKKRNTHILVIADAFSRYIRLFAVQSTTSKETGQKFEIFVNQFGAPKIIITDRGTAFTGNDFKEVCAKYAIRHQLTAAHFPQANGLVESKMKIIIPRIVTAMNFSGENWDKDLHVVERDLNCTVNKTTGYTPFKCLYGYDPIFEEAQMTELANQEEDQTMTQIREQVKEKVTQTQKKYKEYYDKKKFVGVKYDIGEIVVVKNYPVSTGEPTKTQAKYRGPLVVIECLPGDTYRLERLNKEDGGRNVTTVAHVSQMKIYKNHEEDSELDLEEEVEFEVTEENPIQRSEEDESAEEFSSEEWSTDEDLIEPESGTQIEARPRRATRRPHHLADFV